MDQDFTTLRLPDGDDALRPIDWSELVAKLAASRELRRALADPGAGRPGAAAASFAAQTARTLAAAAPAAPGVNLEPSANGKAAQGISGVRDEPPHARPARDRGQR